MRDPYSLIGGLRRDQTSLTLGSDPFLAPVLGAGGLNNLRGDFAVRLWMPYFGLHVGDGCCGNHRCCTGCAARTYYGWYFIYAPWVGARRTIPAALDLLAPLQPPIRRSAHFIEVGLDYSVSVGSSAYLGLWFKANHFWGKRSGRQPPAATSDRGETSLGRYMYYGGFSFNVKF